MTIDKHKAYFAALTDGLQDWLPEKLQFGHYDLVEEAKRLMGDDNRVFQLGQVNSIMPTIAKDGASTVKLPAIALTVDEAVFPKDKPNNTNALLSDLQKMAATIEWQDKAQCLDDTLYHVLYRYTTRVACYKLRTEVSLFDRNRILAAVTSCLQYPGNEEQKFYLLKGDLSGIQAFITANLTLEKLDESSNTAKRLRGRSFYVALLTDFLARYIVEKLGLFQSNIIFSAGGHFTLLLPGTSEVEGKLKQIEEDLNEMLFEEVGMTTALVLAKTKIETNGIDAPFSNVSDYYDELNQELERQKENQYRGYLQKIIGQKKSQIEQEELKGLGKTLGENIPRSGYLIQLNLKEDKDISIIDNRSVVVRLKSTKTVFVAFKNDFIEQTNAMLEKYKSDIKSVKIIKLNATDTLEYAAQIKTNIPISFSFSFVGKYAPTNEKNEVLPFDKLAELCYNDSFEFPQLAVMRLDIDNLGAIFAYGLGGKNTPVSFQQTATLSREFNWFFSGYFNELAREYQIYITYSGGDDAFVVGSWYNILHFVRALHKQFKKFVCHNEKITFSAGIFMCHPHYPVGRFSDDAGDCEKEAKKGDKNAVHVFDHTLSWRSFESKMVFAEKLLNYTKQDGDDIKDPEKLARSLVHRLLRILRSCMKSDGTVRIDASRVKANVARLHYLFARHGFNEKRITEATDGIAKDIIEVILKDFDNPNYLADYLVPFNYVIMKTRKMK